MTRHPSELLGTVWAHALARSLMVHGATLQRTSFSNRGGLASGLQSVGFTSLFKAAQGPKLGLRLGAYQGIGFMRA